MNAFLAICLLIGCWILWQWLVSKCPKCGRSFQRILTDKQWNGSRQIFREGNSNNPSYHETKNIYMNSYTCSYYNHKWKQQSEE